MSDQLSKRESACALHTHTPTQIILNRLKRQELKMNDSINSERASSVESLVYCMFTICGFIYHRLAEVTASRAISPHPPPVYTIDRLFTQR